MDDIVNKECISGKTRCTLSDSTGKLYQKCENNKWSSSLLCLEGQTCSNISNKCEANTSISCEANKMECLEHNHYRKCNESGTAWLAESICPENTICKTENGSTQCVFMCSQGESICSSSSTYKECNNNGKYSDEKTCENGKSCMNGACISKCELAKIKKSYVGCEYYAVELHSGGGYYSGGTYAIVVSNPNDNSVNVSISDGVGQIINRTVLSNSIEIVDVEDHQARNTVYGDFSYHITSDLPIVAYQFSPLGGSGNHLNDASLLIPTTAYDTRYRMLSWSESNTDPQVMTIVAKEDNTTITYNARTTTAAGEGIPEISEGETYTHTLDAGKVLQFVTKKHEENASLNDMNGSLITSDKPIGVFGGHGCTNVPTDIMACDHLEEQLFPTNTWGNHYIVVKTYPRGTETEYYKIVADEDNTLINIDGNEFTLNAGDVHSFDTPSDFEITSDKAIMVGQYMAGQNAGAETGDPSFILQVAVEQFRKNYLFLVPNTYEYDYVTITAPNDAVVNLDASIISENDFVAIGSTAYKRARISLSDGSHSIKADYPIGISVYGYDNYVSYGYPGGLNLINLKGQ